jgi:hypothetical protein
MVAMVPINVQTTMASAEVSFFARMAGAAAAIADAPQID